MLVCDKMAKVNQVWKELNAKMTAKRTRNPSGRNKSQKGTAWELVVQRLTAEPDNKQTFCPVLPREFVEFEYDELTLDNSKQAATHFGLPVKSCDILVSNKGPSCTNINQIPHRKDKVRPGKSMFVLFKYSINFNTIDPLFCFHMYSKALVNISSLWNYKI